MSREKSCFGILFSLSIVVGIVLGIIIRQGMLNNSLDGSLLSASAEDKQENQASLEDTLLVVGVDSMEQSPHLEGAWLVTLCNQSDHPAGTIHLKLITLYPVLAENVTSLEQSQFANPHPPVTVDINDLDAITTLEPLGFTDEKWSQVIIMDEVTMNTAIQLSNVHHPDPIKTPTADLFVKPWNNPKKALHQQWGIITTLCEESTAFGQLDTIQQMIE
ncbi:MAG: hypothetical protein P8046_09940 [Anaerolineales bacterium]